MKTSNGDKREAKKGSGDWSSGRVLGARPLTFPNREAIKKKSSQGAKRGLTAGCRIGPVVCRAAQSSPYLCKTAMAYIVAVYTSSRLVYSRCFSCIGAAVMVASGSAPAYGFFRKFVRAAALKPALGFAPNPTRDPSLDPSSLRAALSCIGAAAMVAFGSAPAYGFFRKFVRAAALKPAWGFAPNPTRDQSLDPSSLRVASSRFSIFHFILSPGRRR